MVIEIIIALQYYVMEFQVVLSPFAPLFSAMRHDFQYRRGCSVIYSFPEYMDPSWYCHLLTAVASSEKFQTFGKREELKIWFEKRATDESEQVQNYERISQIRQVGQSASVQYLGVQYCNFNANRQIQNYRLELPNTRYYFPLKRKF